MSLPNLIKDTIGKAIGAVPPERGARRRPEQLRLPAPALAHALLLRRQPAGQLHRPADLPHRRHPALRHALRLATGQLVHLPARRVFLSRLHAAPHLAARAVRFPEQHALQGLQPAVALHLRHPARLRRAGRAALPSRDGARRGRALRPRRAWLARALPRAAAALEQLRRRQPGQPLVRLRVRPRHDEVDGAERGLLRRHPISAASCRPTWRSSKASSPRAGNAIPPSTAATSPSSRKTRSAIPTTASTSASSTTRVSGPSRTSGRRSRNGSAAPVPSRKFPSPASAPRN